MTVHAPILVIARKKNGDVEKFYCERWDRPLEELHEFLKLQIEDAKTILFRAK